MTTFEKKECEMRVEFLQSFFALPLSRMCIFKFDTFLCRTQVDDLMIGFGSIPLRTLRKKYWARFCTFRLSVYWSFHFSGVQIQLLSINCVFTDSLNINKPDIYYNWGKEAGDGDIKSEFQFKLYEQFKVKIYLIFSHTLELLLMHSERESAQFEEI